MPRRVTVAQSDRDELSGFGCSFLQKEAKNPARATSTASALIPKIAMRIVLLTDIPPHPTSPAGTRRGVRGISPRLCAVRGVTGRPPMGDYVVRTYGLMRWERFAKLPTIEEPHRCDTRADHHQDKPPDKCTELLHI